MSTNISPLFYRKIKVPDENEKSIKLFYDKHSKKLICVSETALSIYDKKGIILKKKVNFQTKSNLISVSVDKMLRYCLLLSETNSLILLSLDSLKSKDMSLDSRAIGHLFISVYCCPIPLHNEVTRFCVIQETKMVIYKVIISKKDEITLSEVFKNKLSSFKSFCYNPVFLVLCIEKNDLIFDLYNLANEKFYSKQFEFVLPLKKERKSTFQKVFSFIKMESKNDRPVKKVNRKHLYYLSTQCFLEKM